MSQPGSAGLPPLAGEDHVCASCGMSDLRAVRFRYNDFELDAVLAELDAHVAGFLDEIAVTTNWDRTATRRPEELRTARWLVRHALHEARHHTQDIAAVGRAVAGG
jgi:hypothetical protein